MCEQGHRAFFIFHICRDKCEKWKTRDVMWLHACLVRKNRFWNVGLYFFRCFFLVRQRITYVMRFFDLYIQITVPFSFWPTRVFAHFIFQLCICVHCWRMFCSLSKRWKICRDYREIQFQFAWWFLATKRRKNNSIVFYNRNNFLFLFFLILNSRFVK